MPKAAPVHRPAGYTAPEATRKERDSRRGSASSRGYDRNWQKIRKAKLADSPICEHCLARGFVNDRGLDVDHIEPFEGKGDPRRLDWDNLQTLCRGCHNDKTHGTHTDAWSLR